MLFHLVTFGCQMNISDCERVHTVIERMGYIWTDLEEEADLLGILSCSVRQKAIDKVYNRIHKWNSWKQNRNLLTFLSGCILPADKEKFLKLFDLVFTIEELPGFENMIRHYGVITPLSLKQPDKSQSFIAGKAKRTASGIATAGDESVSTLSPVRLESLKPREASSIQLGNFWNINPTYQSSFEAFVPIQNGCDKFCTFCAVPYTRGREISRPSVEIFAEIHELINRDYKSITLLGQNVNSYGRDKKGAELSFRELLEKIGEMGDRSGKDLWIYFTSPHPKDMNEEVIKTINRYKSLARQVHLPIQSGDEKILIKMNRNHTVQNYRKIVNAIRKWIPEATIFTDIIVGFTGETEQQFQNTRTVIEEFKYNMAYIAMYSPRPGAVSSRWIDDISQEIKKERLHILSKDLVKHTSAYNRNMIGKTFSVLVTGQDRKEGYLSGHTEGRIIVRFPSVNHELIGKFVNIKITSSADFSVEGKLQETINPEPADKK